LRTIHSIINTTPAELLVEIILIDDFSKNSESSYHGNLFWFHLKKKFCLKKKEDLKKPLEKYIKRFDGKVKLFRNSKNEGLIKARIIGVEMAKGEVVVILDAHIECGLNWLPPLLTRIKLNRYDRSDC
jgi:polypeptide N-acetylgalactosaminyltransferase